MTNSIQYVPGVCNIGEKEVTKRKRTGWIGLVIAVVLEMVLVATDASTLWQLTLFFPAMISTAGFLQAYMEFCAYFGFASLFNFDDVGNAKQATGASSSREDRRTAWMIVWFSIMAGALVALTAYILRDSGWSTLSAIQQIPSI